MQSKTVTTEFTGELLYLGQTLSKSGPKVASAMRRRKVAEGGKDSMRQLSFLHALRRNPSDLHSRFPIRTLGNDENKLLS